MKFLIVFCVTISTLFQLVQNKSLNKFCRIEIDAHIHIKCEGITIGENTTNYDVLDFLSGNERFELTLYNSHIPLLHGDLFSEWSGMFLLNISNVGITRINSPINLKTADQLHTLDLSHNKLKNVSGGTFKHLTGLRFIYLSYNELRSLDHDTFEGPIDLVYLELKGNRLELLSGNDFKELKKLETLDLSENRIIIDSEDFFSHNYNLRTLKLKGAFEYDRYGLFSFLRNLENLEYLDLSQNFIYHQKVPIGHFADLHQLKYLNLSATRLNRNSLQYGMFTSLKNLEILDLSCNEISGLNTDVFAFLSNLKELYMHFNQIGEGMTLEYNKNLIKISLSDNKWSCPLLTEMLANFYRRNITIDFSRSQVVKNSQNVEGIECYGWY